MTTHHRAVNMGSSSYGRPRTREPGHSEHAETGRDGTGYKIVACCRHAPSRLEYRSAPGVSAMSLTAIFGDPHFTFAW
jgi:hypothetical protein